MSPNYAPLQQRTAEFLVASKSARRETFRPRNVLDIDEPARACPIVGSCGAKDWTLRGVADRLERALSTAGVDHDGKEYPDAGHAFLSHHDRADVPLLFVVMGKISGAKYHEPSAQDTRRRIVSFFNSSTAT
jgi:carboxymethylenebutenolidase